MIRFFLSCLKLGVIATVVLLLGQIHVGKKRISDYVGEIAQHHRVQHPITWVAQRFDFTAGIKIRQDKAAPTNPNTSDNGRLSGLHKQSR